MSRTSPVSDAEWMAIYRRLAEDGDAHAMFMLSQWLRQGRACAEDPAAADRWLRRAARTLPAAQLEMGDCAQGNPMSPPTAPSHVARRWFRRAAKAGIATAWHALGSMEFAIPRTPGSVATARRMHEKALPLGQSMARVWLALDFDAFGADLDEVERWLSRSLILDGENQAQGLLAAIRVARPFLRRLAEQPFSTWRLLAEAGDLEAQTCLGYAYQYGRGVPRDVPAAETWFERAARAGGRDARLALALAAWDFASRISDDYDEAAFWAALAAKGGEPIALWMAGLLEHYRERSSFRKTARWWRAAAEKGHPEAAHRFGRCLMFGIGVPKDPAAAVRWLRRAAESGVPDALCSLGVLHHNGKRAPMDRPFAVTLYHAAAKLGNGWAHYLLGLSYRDGEGVPRSRRLARAWFRKATALGVRKAAHAERAMSGKPA